jgi:hypothetical protein
MKSTKTILSDYDPDGRPLTAHPKRLTKRMRKRIFGKGPAGKPGRGRIYQAQTGKRRAI